MEVTNRLKVLDVVNTVPGELWTEVHNIIQEVANKKKKKSKKAKWLSEEALQVAEERKVKSKGERERKHATLIARDHLKSCKETEPKSATGKSTVFN